LTQDYDLKRGAPPLDPALIGWLDAAYPERCPRSHMSERDIWMEAGARHLINRLISLHNKQTERSSATDVHV